MEQCEYRAGLEANFVFQNLAQFVRTHEKALANALQLRRQAARPSLASSASGDASPTQISGFQNPTLASSTTSALAAAFSLGALKFTSQSIKPAKLTLTPHHLFYLLSRFEEIGIAVGPMNVRLENLNAETSPGNYVSFLSQAQRSKGRSDRDSIHSVSSVRSVMSGVSSLWSNLGISSSSSAAKTDKAKAQLQIDLKYLYSAFTKIPCLRLSPDRKARLIGGYEEFPFDSAVPLLAFKNLSALEVCDIDFRQFYGWDKLAEQLRSLTLKRAHVDDANDLLVGIVLDDMDKRRRRSYKSQSSPTPMWPLPSPSKGQNEFIRTHSAPGSPVVDERLGQSASPRNSLYLRGEADVMVPRARPHSRTKSISPTRPSSSRQNSSYRHIRGGGKMKRSGSGSSNSSEHSMSAPSRNRSSSNLPSLNILPASKWRFLRHLSLADNSLTYMTATSLSPLANTLHALDLSSNLFSEVPDCLASLTALRALNLSNCMIESLHSLARNPIPAITALNLRSNRLASLAGIERLLSLERLDLRNNQLTDSTEIARLTGIPDIREIWVLGNPFVRTYSNYRLTIFNLFRGTPGYTDDVVIDNTGPGYSERRQLRDRVAEIPGVPVVKPLPLEVDLPQPITFDSTTQNPFHDLDSSANGRFRPVPHTTQSEIAVGSNRRKRGPRRRIVDLAVDEGAMAGANPTPISTPPRKPQVAFAEVSGASFISPEDYSPRTKPSLLGHLESRTTEPARQALEPETLRRSPSPSPLSQESPLTQEPILSPSNEPDIADELQRLNLNGETYRRKVEALKDEFGSRWLSVLSEEGWNGQGPDKPSSENNISHMSAGRPDISNLRMASQGIVSGNRTLG